VILPDGTLRPQADSRPLPAEAGRQMLMQFFAPWEAAQEEGAVIFAGEWGAYDRTPHEVVLSWMRDWLSVWNVHSVGWALWEFRGAFGVLDSNRTDVTYKDFHGHKLDPRKLELLL
jgi:endoglucanase